MSGPFSFDLTKRSPRQKIPRGNKNVLICQNIKNTVTAECTVDVTMYITVKPTAIQHITCQDNLL